MQTLTLFVSSPGDVRDERQAVGRIVERLQARYWNLIRLEPVLWEKEPLRATAHFNEELIRPSDCDLFVCVLWSRLSSPLPSQFNRKDGTRFDSGTEWELEEATGAFEARAAKKDKKDGKPKPDILVYRRMSERPAGSDPAQGKKLDAFCERFFFNKDKTVRRAFSPYETVDDFMALFEQHLEKLLLRHIQLHRGLAEDAVRPLPLEGSPFKGLGTFDYDDAPLFFGRNRPIAEALNQLKANHAAGHAFLLIYGGSGYGKSSLMRAGLAPRLTADGYLPEVGAWCGTTVLPVEGDAPPLETLARAISGALPELAKIRDTSRAVIAPAPPKGKKGRKSKSTARPEPVWDSARLARTLGSPEELVFGIAAIVAALDRLSAAKPANFLLLVDQLEEIFTARDVTAGMRDAFFHVLAALAMSRRIWVVATMRSEFFPRVPEHRDLFQLVRHGGGYILGPPELPELQQIIRYPALAAGLQFERHPESGRDLSEPIYQDAANAHDALPLLEFTLEELYQRRSENVLTWAAYQELGGLAGAIARRAQETYDALPSETRRDAARQIFGELVTLDAANEGPATRRRAKRAELEAAHPGASAFLTAFIDAKLLVTGSEDEAATVTLAHETLITRWPVLKQWIEDHRDLLLARRRLEDATRLWNDATRSTRFYLTEGRLAEAGCVESSGVFRLSADESELVRLSRIRARRKLRLFQGATVVFAGLAAAAGVLGVIAKKKQNEAVVAQGKALDSAAETRRSLAAADFDAGAARIEDGAPDEGLPFLLSALENDAANLEAQALLFDTLRQTSWNFPTGEIAHPVPVTRLAFGPDRDTLFAATGDIPVGFNSVLRWNLADATLTSQLVPTWGEETQVLVISPNGRRAVVQRGYKRAEVTLLCDAVTMKPVTTLPAPMDAGEGCFAWSPDGVLFAYPAVGPAPGYSLTWRIADAATGLVVRETEALPSDASEPLAVQLDSKRLRGLHSNGLIVEMPLDASKPVRTASSGGNEELEHAVFSPDGGEFYARLRGRGLHEDGEHSLFAVNDEDGELKVNGAYDDGSGSWLSSAAVLSRFPWSDGVAPVWQQLFDQQRAGRPLVLQGGLGEVTPPLSIDGPRLESIENSGGCLQRRAPFVADSRIRSVAFSGGRFAVGTSSGKLLLGEFLPRLSATPAQAQAQAQEEDPGWQLRKTFPDGRRLEQRGFEARLVTPEESAKPVDLPMHPMWQLLVDVALDPSGKRAVVAGYGSSTGGLVSPGVLLADAATGSILSDLEPVENVAKVDFFGEQLAVVSENEVLMMEVSDKGFTRRGSMPVSGGLALFGYGEGDARRLAVATADRVLLHDLTDISQVAVLRQARQREVPEKDGVPLCWAHDEARGWIALRIGREVDIWGSSSGRRLISNLQLPGSNSIIRFSEEAGLLVLRFGEGKEDFVPLASVSGVTAEQHAALRALAEGLGGQRYAEGSKSIVRLDRRARLAALDRDFGKLSAFFPGADAGALAKQVAALPFVTVAGDQWLPLWQRLALSTSFETDRIVRWSAALGDHPWRQAYVRGLICDEDAALFELMRDPLGWQQESDAPTGIPDMSPLHRLAGDPDEVAVAKRAAWIVQRTRPEVAGAALGEEEVAAETPEVDAEGLRKLDPAALDALRTALANAPRNDWRLELLDHLAERPAALSTLEARVKSTGERYAQSKSAADGYAYLEALAWSGDMAKARELAGKLAADDAVPSLSAAHGILAAGLGDAAAPAVDRALEAHGSPWLWQDWLAAQAAKEGPLAPAVERVMKAADGRGIAAVSALRLAVERNDAEAILAVLKDAKGMPDAVRAYATARALWSSGDKAGVYSMWPDEPPPLADLAESADWNGWEQVLDGEALNDFYEGMKAQVAVLQAKPDASLDDLRALATLLLDPATTTTFGIRRVRDAMVACSLVLSADKVSGPLVEQMVDRARLAGASPTDCLRIEARTFMAAGEFTAAYSRWLQLIDTQDAEIFASDYLEAAACVFEDMQDAAAIKLTLRGKDEFPSDPTYAYDGAWLLLTAGHPEEAGILLEHGFKIPFTEDQKQTAIAMLLCAAEQTGRADRADGALQELLEISPDWGDEEAIKSLEWPEALTENLLSVAERNR